jgi:hypothetical protein
MEPSLMLDVTGLSIRYSRLGLVLVAGNFVA